MNDMEPMLPMTEFHIQRRTIVEETGNGFPWMWAFFLILALLGFATWQGNKTEQDRAIAEQAKAKAEQAQSIMSKEFWKQDGETDRALIEKVGQ